MVARKGRIVQEINANAAGNEHENLNDETIVLRDDGEAAFGMEDWTISDEADHTDTVHSRVCMRGVIR